MLTRNVSVIAVSVAVTAVAVAGAATAVTASVPHAKAVAAAKAAPSGALYVHQIKPAAHSSVTKRIPAHQQTGRLMPVHVPAGKYLINLSVVFSSGSEASAGLYCSVKAVGQTNTTFGTGLDGFVGGAVGYTSASEQDAVVMTTPGAISAYCGTNSGNTTGTAGIYTADLTALAVSAVHRTGS